MEVMQRLLILARRATNYINTHRKQMIIGGVIVLVLMYAAVFFLPQPVKLSYAGDNCVGRLTLLPGIHQSSDSSPVDISYKDTVKIGSFILASRTSCVELSKPTKAGTVVVSSAPYGSVVARSHYSVTVPSLPKLSTASLAKPFPISKPLALPLSQTDETYTYSLKIAEQMVPCAPVKKAVSCDIPKLGLKQDQPYEAKVLRAFKTQQPAELTAMSVRTLRATTVVKGSIKPGQTVYNRPKTITYTTDKTLESATIRMYKSDDASKEIPLTVETKNKTVTATLPAELEREKKYELVVDEVEATDGSTLVEPYKVAFEMSGGPKVKSISIGSSRVDSNAAVMIDFDQPLAKAQSITEFVRLTGGGATVTKLSPTRVQVALASLPRCAPFSISVAAGLKSEHDIVSKSPWKFSSRTICYSLSTIGASVQGRAITAYTFGNSGPVTLFVGAIHGNEVSSSLILQDWVSELEANHSRIPADARIVIVPTVNPDGVAAGTRNNARNVNLNRNFPTSNWTKNINDTNGKVPGGGGASPLSEPEAKALANLSSSLRPRLMVSYHAVGSLVVGDPGGYSAGYAAKYASMVGYRNATGQSSNTFDYDITGSYEDWTIQKAGIPSMVVELGSYSYRSFAHHREAFWAMLQ